MAKLDLLFPQFCFRTNCNKTGDRLLSKPCYNRTRTLKIKEGRSRLDRRKKFFTMWVMKHWHRLPREVVNAPSLKAFRAGLDGALSNMMQLKMSLLIAGWLD